MPKKQPSGINLETIELPDDFQLIVQADKDNLTCINLLIFEGESYVFTPKQVGKALCLYAQIRKNLPDFPPEVDDDT